MKNLLFVISLLLIFGLGCGKKEEKKVEAPKETQKVESPTETKTAKTFTDDDFIEYWAQTAYLTEKFAKDPIRLGQELNKMYEKLGITEKESEKFGEKYTEWLTNWQQKSATNPEKIGKEWEALMKRYEKRVAELKAGK